EVKCELESEDFQFRIGVEADFFVENICTLKDIVAGQPRLDYVIGACHYSEDFTIYHAAEAWAPLDAAAPHQISEVYLRKLLGLCQAGCFDFIAHLDLPKKFGEWLPQDLEPLMEEVLQAAAQAGLPIEINTAGLDKPCQEWYPSEPILRRAIELGIPLLVNADAHATSQVTRHFAAARNALKLLGVNKLCEFTGRRRRLIELD
ncbi:MAG: hypothetical protein J6Y80_02275, partial [Victivallales bacterium]|nr:hypothetical protein [Victivallales bacterium]